MSRPATGTVETRSLGDGTRVFKLRFYVDGRREHEVLHERRDCTCGCGGSWNERTAAVELERRVEVVRRAAVIPGPGLEQILRVGMEGDVPVEIASFAGVARETIEKRPAGERLTIVAAGVTDVPMVFKAHV